MDGKVPIPQVRKMTLWYTIIEHRTSESAHIPVLNRLSSRNDIILLLG